MLTSPKDEAAAAAALAELVPPAGFQSQSRCTPAPSACYSSRSAMQPMSSTAVRDLLSRLGVKRQTISSDCEPLVAKMHRRTTASLACEAYGYVARFGVAITVFSGLSPDPRLTGTQVALTAVRVGG